MAGAKAPRKFPVALDEDLLARAQSILGTSTKVDTIRAALDRVVREALWKEEVAHAEAGGYADLADPELRRGLWQRGSDAGA